MVGECAGGLFTGHAALSTGAPWAVLLYVALTALAWPKPGPDGGEAPPSRSWLGETLRVVWLIGSALACYRASSEREDSAHGPRWDG